MKFLTLLAATTLAAGASAQQACDSAKLIAIVGGSNGIACTASTGYSPATLSLPSGTVLRNVCSNLSCTALLQEITAAVPTECTFNGVAIKSSLVDRFPTACAAALGTTTAPSAANSTASPNATSSSSASSSSSNAASSPTPTPTPTKRKTKTTQSSASSSGESSSVGEEVTVPGSASRPDSDDSITRAPSTDSSSSVPAPTPTSRLTPAPAPPSSSSPELFALTGAVAAMAITAAML